MREILRKLVFGIKTGGITRPRPKPKARPIMEQARLDLDAKLLSAAKKLREYDQQDGDALLMWAKDYGYGTGSDTIETLLEILEG